MAPGAISSAVEQLSYTQHVAGSNPASRIAPILRSPHVRPGFEERLAALGWPPLVPQRFLGEPSLDLADLLRRDGQGRGGGRAGGAAGFSPRGRAAPRARRGQRRTRAPGWFRWRWSPRPAGSAWR